MSDKKNYYEILKVSPLASLPTIKKSYRKLVQIHHPDKNPNDPKAEEKFKAINEAYEVLSDTFKRKDFDRQIKKEKEAKTKPKPSYRYDSFHTPFESSNQRPTSKGEGLNTEGLETKPSYPPKSPYSLKNFKNYFKKDSANQLGTLEISLEEAAFGCEKKVFHPVLRNGVLKKECFIAHIPSGAEETQKIKLKSSSGKKLNLYMSLTFKKHSLFKKEGKNILMNLPIPFTKAILGGAVEIPTLMGKVSFKLVAGGVHAGHVILLKKQGFPDMENPKNRGNMLITLLIDVPSNLSEEEKIKIKLLQNKDLLYAKVREFDIKAKLLLKKRQK